MTAKLDLPLPTSPSPGRRAAVAILNGTTNTEAVSAAVPKVVAGGGEVAVVGKQFLRRGDHHRQYLYGAAEAAERIASRHRCRGDRGRSPADRVSTVCR
ncbi:MAG: hypothetical protein R2716_00650 [Microthrixaceae bacterium]